MTDSELLDLALEHLVQFKSDEPCEAMSGNEYCEEHCVYPCPTKECWKTYIKMTLEET